MRAWLMRIHTAASQKNFQGTFVVSGGGSVASARIAHFCEGHEPVRADRVARRAGPPCVPPQRHRPHHLAGQPARAGRAAREGDAVPGACCRVPTTASSTTTRFSTRGDDRVAGHEANVLLVRARDRPAIRLSAVGREEVRACCCVPTCSNERNEVIETSAFSEVADRRQVRPRQRSAADAQARRLPRRSAGAGADKARSRRLGHAPGWCPGFRQVSCVRRPMDASHPWRVRRTRQHSAVQAIFSDGLTYVSVFIEPYDAQRHTRPIRGPIGATQTLMRRQGDSWITVIGEVPAVPRWNSSQIRWSGKQVGQRAQRSRLRSRAADVEFDHRGSCLMNSLLRTRRARRVRRSAVAIAWRAVALLDGSGRLRPGRRRSWHGAGDGAG